MPSFFLRIGGSLLLASCITSGALAVEGDVIFKRKGPEGGLPVAVFPHWIHRIRYKCYACHPTPFEMKAGTSVVTMEEIAAGKSCGVCHNGKTAWAANFETCSRCHVGK